MFAERLLSLAGECNNQGVDAIERQLIDAFFDGLTNHQLKLKILKDHSDTLQAVIGRLTTIEQNLGASVYKSHTKPTPESMEDDHSRGQRFRARNKFNRVNSTANNGST